VKNMAVELERAICSRHRTSRSFGLIQMEKRALHLEFSALTGNVVRKIDLIGNQKLLTSRRDKRALAPKRDENAN